MIGDVRLVSGHYWPCLRLCLPRDCPDCRERHLRDERDRRPLGGDDQASG